MKISKLFDNDWIFLAILIAAALSVKIAFVQALSGSIFAVPCTLDEQYYDRWAQQISSGAVVGKNAFYGLPLYPYLMGALYWAFGKSLYVIRMAQAFLGTASCVLLYFIAGKFFSKKAARIAAAMFVLYGLFTFYEGYILNTTLAVTLYLLAILLLSRSFETASKALFYISGIVVALAGLAMPGIFMYTFFIILGVYLFLKDRLRAIIIISLFLLGIATPISMTTLHNYLAEKDIVFVTAHSGITFYTGNNPRARAVFTPVEGLDAYDMESFVRGARDMAEKAAGKKLKSSEVSSYWSSKAMKFISGQPLAYLRLLGEKMVYFFNKKEIYDIAMSPSTMASYIPVLRALFLNYALIFPLAAAGIFFSIRNRVPNYLLYSFLISYSAANIMFMINSRYRLPIVPVLIIYAAYGIAEIWHAVKTNTRIAVYSFLVLILGIVIMSLPAGAASRNQETGDREIVALLCLQKGEYDKALEIYNSIIEKNGLNYEVYNNMAKAYIHKGMLDKAESAAKRSMEIRDGFSDAHYTLGVIYDAKNLVKDSIEEFKKAVSLMPNNAEYHYCLGFGYLKNNETLAGIESVEKAIDMSANPRYYVTLGTAYMVMGNKDKALACWREALELDPKCAQAQENLSKYGKPR